MMIPNDLNPTSWAESPDLPEAFQLIFPWFPGFRHRSTPLPAPAAALAAAAAGLRWIFPKRQAARKAEKARSRRGLKRW